MLDRLLGPVENKFGEGSLDRVREMLADPRQVSRSPQQGAKWILPGITSDPWLSGLDTQEFGPLIKALCESLPALRDELAGVASHRAADQYLHHMGTFELWKAIYFYRQGCIQSSSFNVAPVTATIVQDFMVMPGLICPLLECHSSTLLPGARIPTHSDFWNFTVNLHFPVAVPSDCGLKVAGETRTWKEGVPLFFDYSFEHSAWNDNGADARVCLLADLWHPEVTMAEREALEVVFSLML